MNAASGLTLAVAWQGRTRNTAPAFCCLLIPVLVHADYMIMGGWVSALPPPINIDGTEGEILFGVILLVIFRTSL